VCLASVQPSTKMVSIGARRQALCRWAFVFSPLAIMLARRVANSNRPWGVLPAALGEALGTDPLLEYPLRRLSWVFVRQRRQRAEAAFGEQAEPKLRSVVGLTGRERILDQF